MSDRLNIDALEDLALELRAAAHRERGAHRFRAPRLRAPRRGFFVVVAALALTGGTATATGLLSPPSAATQADQAFALFRAPADNSDVIPGSQQPDAISRQLAVDADGRLYAQVRTNGNICLVHQGDKHGSVGCSDAATATSVSSPPFYIGLTEDGQILVAGLMPDGVEDVQLHAKSGVVSGKVRENAFAISAHDAVSLSWADQDGKTYTTSGLGVVNARP